MANLQLILGAAACVLGVTTTVLISKLRAAKLALADAERRLAVVPPPPPRIVESRREAFVLLWFPVLTVKDDEKRVVSAVAGLPHCIRCVRAMNLEKGPPEEWVCPGCADRRAGSAADIMVTDSVIADAVAEFALRHPGYRVPPTQKTARRDGL